MTRSVNPRGSPRSRRHFANTAPSRLRGSSRHAPDEHLVRRAVVAAADAGHRVLHADDVHTVMTASISGRPARCLVNRFTALAAELTVTPPDYPIAYHAGKALHAAASARGEHGYGAQWAGQGAPLARAMPAAELVATLAREMVS